jgi:hypothetical protein
MNKFARKVQELLGDQTLMNLALMDDCARDFITETLTYLFEETSSIQQFVYELLDINTTSPEDSVAMMANYVSGRPSYGEIGAIINNCELWDNIPNAEMLKISLRDVIKRFVNG